MSKRHDRSTSDWKREAERLRDYEDAVLAISHMPVELLTVRGALEHAASAHLKRGEGVEGGGGKMTSRPPTGDPRFRELLDRSDDRLRKYAEDLWSDFTGLLGEPNEKPTYGPGVRR